MTESMKAIRGLKEGRHGMVLPFEPIHFTFSRINYYVPLPAVHTSTSLCPIIYLKRTRAKQLRTCAGHEC